VNVSVGTPTVFDQVRDLIERHLPWYDPEAEERRRQAAELAFAQARRVRVRANRVIRAHDGYRAYGARVHR